MTLRNDLYTVVDSHTEADTARYTIALNAGHYIYQAHFPGLPITPGVCLLQITKELLEDYCGLTINIAHIKNVKFLAPVSPTELPEVVVALDHIVADGERAECRAQMLSPDGKVLSKLSFKCNVSDRRQ